MYSSFENVLTLWQKIIQDQFFKNTDLAQNDANILQMIFTNAQLAATTSFLNKILSSLGLFLDKCHLNPRNVKSKNLSLSKLLNLSAMLVCLLKTFRMHLIPSLVSRGLDPHAEIFRFLANPLALE